MEAAVEHLKDRLSVLRTGAANASVLDHVQVECYGTQVALNTVANVLAHDKRNLIVRPFDTNIIPEIEKAIHQSKVGLTPIREAKHIRLPVPPLSEERRRELVKEAKSIAESQRVAIRNIRRDSLKAYVPLSEEGEKNFKTTMEGLTLTALSKVEETLTAKTGSLLAIDERWNPDPKSRNR